MTTEQIVAKKYATAFLNYYKESLKKEKINALLHDARSLVKHKRALFFLQHASIPLDQKETMLLHLCPSLASTGKSKRIIQILFLHKRIFLLADILTLIVSLYQRRNKILSVRLISAHPLSKERETQFISFLAKQTGYAIMYTMIIDKRLIAGVRMQSAFFMWEYSIAQQLKKLNGGHKGR